MGIFKPNVAKMKAHGDVEGLAQALSHKDGVVSIRAFQALANLRDVRAVEPLIPQLLCRETRVRCYAAELLGMIDDSRAVEPLIVALRDHPSVRQKAIESLGRLRDARAVEPLIAALVGKEYWDHYSYAQAVAEALGKIADARAIETLALMITTPLSPANVVDAAARALRRIGGSALVSPTAMEALNRLIANPDDGIRSWAVAALGTQGDARAVEPLIAALTDTMSDVRGNAATALGNLGDVRAVEPLIAALTDTVSDVRGRAATALGNLGDVRAVEPLLYRASRRYSEKAAQDALAAFGLRALEPMVRCLTANTEPWYVLEWLAGLLAHPDKGVRVTAAEELAAMDNSRVVKPLIGMLTSERGSTKPMQVLDTLRAFGADFSDADRLALSLAKIDHGDTTGLAEILAMGAAAVEPLVRAVEDGSFRIAAVGALAQLHDERAVERGIKVLADAANLDKGSGALDLALASLHAPGASEPLLRWLFRERLEMKVLEMFVAARPFGDYTDIVLRASSGFRYWVSDDITLQGSATGSEQISRVTFGYSIDLSDEALSWLCSSKSPITTNLLHLFAGKEDMRVVYEQETFGESVYGTLSFEDQRQRARDELKARGDPPYDPELYLQEGVWDHPPISTTSPSGTSSEPK